MLELPKKIVSTRCVQPLPLTDCGADLENIGVIAAGNGRTSTNSSDEWNKVLREIRVETMTAEVCTNVLKWLGNKQFSVICTKPDSTGYGTAYQGDSGNVAVSHFME